MLVKRAEAALQVPTSPKASEAEASEKENAAAAAADYLLRLRSQ